VARGLADPAIGHARDEIVERHVDVDRGVDPGAARGEGSIEGGRLADRPREAVEDRPAGGVGLGETVEEDLHDRLVGNELARLHQALDLAPERAARLRDGPEEVARGEDRHAEMGSEHRRLCALAGPGSSEQDDYHDRRSGAETPRSSATRGAPISG
jgi:hypothetical protein